MSTSNGYTDAALSVDRYLGAATTRDRQVLWRRLRRRGGVHRLADDGQARFVVVGYTPAAQLLAPSSPVTSGLYDSLFGPVIGETLLGRDGEEHRSLRELVQPALSSTGVRDQLSRTIESAVIATLDRLPARGPVDLVGSVCLPYPARVASGLLGLDEHRTEVVRQALSRQVCGSPHDATTDPDLRRAIADALVAHEDPPSYSAIVDSVAKSGMPIDAQANYLVLLLLAATETTYRALGLLLLGVVSCGQFGRLRGPDWAAAAFEEAVRWESPIQWLVRHAVAPIEVEGIEIPEGAQLLIVLGSANRDDSRWEHPDSFDPARSFRPNLAFGGGAHVCVGSHLAKRSVLALIDALSRHFDDATLTQEAKVIGGRMRAPVRLDIEAS